MSSHPPLEKEPTPMPVEPIAPAVETEQLALIDTDEVEADSFEDQEPDNRSVIKRFWWMIPILGVVLAIGGLSCLPDSEQKYGRGCGCRTAP